MIPTNNLNTEDVNVLKEENECIVQEACYASLRYLCLLKNYFERAIKQSTDLPEAEYGALCKAMSELLQNIEFEIDYRPITPFPWLDPVVRFIYKSIYYPKDLIGVVQELQKVEEKELKRISSSIIDEAGR